MPQNAQDRKPAPTPDDIREWRTQRSRFILGDLAATDERAPCHDCPHAIRCMTEKLSCQQLAVFVRLPRRARWSFAARQPSRAIHADVAAWLRRKVGTSPRRGPAPTGDDRQA
jgi:hypothetical protein